MNNYTHKLILLGLFLSSVSVFSQIQEERLVLEKKREPEVKKIEKKKTSVETIKNYPPEEKSAVELKYTITNVPASSDFQTSTIAGSDIAPDFQSEKQDNYFRLGYGNYSKFLADAALSTRIEENLEVGADLHFLSTKGLTKEYAWNSKQSAQSVGAYVNSYGAKGKLNLNANFAIDDYNLYGIYAMTPDKSIDLQQKVNEFKINGYYDFYSNEILNDVRMKTSFLSDHFDAKESQVSLLAHLSKHGVSLPIEGISMNADLGLGLENLTSEFSLLNKNQSQFLNLELSPELTFRKGDSYLRVGSGFSFLNSKFSDLNSPTEQTTNQTYWFPKAEVLLAASPEFKFYAGIDGGLELNSYSKMLSENPFLVSDQQIKPTETKYHFYFGVKGDLDQQFKYDLNAGFGKINDLMFFGANSIFDTNDTLNRSAYNFANTFSALYDNGTLNSVNASLSYFPMANLVIEGEMNYESYKLDTYSDIYNKPLVTASIGAQYTMLDKKLHLGFKGLFASQRTTNSFAITSMENTAVPGTQILVSTENRNDKVKGYGDLNLSAEYKIHKNFSIFALGNNLLSSKYESYKGYKVLGAQIVGGVKITF